MTGLAVYVCRWYYHGDFLSICLWCQCGQCQPPSLVVSSPRWGSELFACPSLSVGDRGKELVDLGVGLGDLLSVGRSTDLASSPNVGARWVCLHQRHLLRLRQVLQLDRQQGEVSDGDHPRLLVPVQDVLLLQPVRVLSYPTTSRQ